MTTTELKESATNQNDESQNTTSSTKKRGTRADVVLQQQQPDCETFYKNLIAFNERRNTPIVRMPKISGEDIDLHKLYTEVISRGGWLKVNIRNEWEDVLSELDISSKCVNGVVALKQIYCRFLDKYEKFHFLGEDPDRPDEPDDDDRQSRHKKWSEKSTPIVPMSYNYLQHNVNEQTRIANKMSTDFYKNTEYEKLLMSLMSPLPNEQDFAINVCTLMANESKHTLRMENCPKLLEALIAHAGVFCHASTRDLFDEFYRKTRKHSLQSFWNDLLYKAPQILELSYEDSANPNDENANIINKRIVRESVLKETFEDGLNADTDDENEMDEIDIDRLEFLSLNRGLGTSEYIGQRVNQISSIIRNLSFFEENIPIMSKNRTFLRYLVMCSNVRWGNIHHMALDVCGNIAGELELLDPTTDNLTRCLISTLCEGIESQDRGVIISSLEILNKLSQKDTNEDYLLKCLNQKLYNQLCLFLSLNDIMLLLYTLECIYGLSSLGSTPCNAFVQVKGIVDTLVSLITVEAQSYGPDGCILMRVVETVPGNMLPMVAQNIANLQNVTLGQLKQQPTPQVHPVQSETPQKVPIVAQPAIIPNVISTAPIQQGVTSNSSLPIKPHLPVAPVNATTTQESEQFAIAWLTATLENAPPITNRIEQQELYKLYTAAMVKNGKRVSVPQTHFPRILRSIFGTNVGPTLLKVADPKGTETNKFFYVNLRYRSIPLPLKNVQQASQPILNQQQPDLQTGSQQANGHQNLQNTTAITNSSTNSVITSSNTQTSSQNLLNNSSNTEIKSNQQDYGIAKQPAANNHSVPQQSNQQPQILIQQQSYQQQQQQMQHSQQSLAQQQQQQSFTSQNQQHNSFAKVSQIIKSPQIQITQHSKQQSDMNQHQQQSTPKMIGNVIITQHTGQIVTKTTTIGQTQMTTTTHVPSTAGGSTAIIKSLLANKVTTTTANNNNNFTSPNQTTSTTLPHGGSNGSLSTTCAVKESIVSAVNANNSNYLITQNVNLHQLAQRQNLAKQKEISIQQHTVHGNSYQTNHSTPQKMSTTTISALVNNPNIQTTSVKVGQTTIKPINPQNMEKKLMMHKSVESMETSSWEPVPPLAPLGNSTIRSIIVPGSSISTASEDSCNSVASSAISTSHVILNDDGESSVISFDGLLIPKSKSATSSILEDDSSKDSTIKASQFINANKMLVNLLDKKSSDPPALTIGIKRKMSDDNKNRKKPMLEDSETAVTPSKNAANLYAEMAASILEDEDLEDVIPTSKMHITTPSSTMQTITTTATQKQSNALSSQPTMQTVIQKPQDVQKQIISMPMHRQIIMSPSVSQQQVVLSQSPVTVQSPHHQQQQQTMTTSSMQHTAIKTDSNVQSVPVQIVHKQMNSGGQIIQQQMLQQHSQPQTQYVLATNQQGQTYLVAQQTHSQPFGANNQSQPTVLLTQNQNQQNGPTKTIIILQQQGGPPQAVAQQQIIAGGPGQPQKMIMTTPQGQQMIVTQVPRPQMQQIIVNQSGNVIPPNMVLTQSVMPQGSAQSHQIQQIQHVAQQSQLSPQLHIQQTMLNTQNQTHSLVPHLTSNGATIHIQQQTQQQQQQQQQLQQASILSSLPQIPATIKLHTPNSTTILNNKPNTQQQQNLGSKTNSKLVTPTISIVAQNPVISQANTMQPQIIQQIVKAAPKPVNSPGPKITIHQQTQNIQQQQNRPQVVQQQIIQQPQMQQQMQQKHQQQMQQQNQQQQPAVIIQKHQTFQPNSPQMQNSTLNVTNSPQSQSSQNAKQQKIILQPQQSPKLQQSSIQSANSQHQNIVQQILAQNPSQTQIIQQSPASVITTQSVIVNQATPATNSNPQAHTNSTHYTNAMSSQSNMNANNTTSGSSNQSMVPNLSINQVQPNQSINQAQPSQTNSSQDKSNTNSNPNCNSNPNSPAPGSGVSTGDQNSTATNSGNSLNPPPPPPSPIQKLKNDENIADISYLYVCDWRNCPRKKYNSVQEVYKHACQVHCPEGLDPGAEIYCQWGPGPSFCDNIPRKRFSLMTHLLDRHCTLDAMKAAVQRRLTMGISQPTHANPVTIIKSNEARGSTASPALSTSSSGSVPSTAVVSAAMQAIKRHSTDFINPKELMDENEGPVTKSIRLTAALILRNLATYTDKAKRHIRQYEPHLASVALSNVESSRTISQILFELNN